MAQKIIIDTDPGIDDAMAILAALHAPELKVLGLTTVFGNTEVELCSLNALRLVELEGNDHIPVAQGCGQPMVHDIISFSAGVHGKDGFGNTNLPLPHGKLDPRHAAQFIIDTVMANPHEVILAPLGPLTNIAMAYRLEPRIAPLVKEVVLMGGCAFALGNISAVAEANIYHDPHAAEVVFAAPWKVTMVGLDVTTKIVMRPDYFEKLYAAGNPAVELLEKIQPCYQAFHEQIYGLKGAIHTHDPAVIAYLLAPELFRCEAMPVYVVTEGLCLGKTIADKHHHIFRSTQAGKGIGEESGAAAVERPATTIPLGVDEDGVLQLLFKLLTKN
ncbi:MAG TPA: nucleoside hydrolase [Anaerolineaceae bacterium]|nr:nucleoside hydrolase [Anaerolineaceae bacterium]